MTKDFVVRISVDHRIRDCRPEFREFKNYAGLGEQGREQSHCDVFDQRGGCVFTATCFGPIDEDVLADLMDWAAGHGGVTFEIYEGPKRRYHCCGVTFTESELPDGSVAQYWMQHHGRRTDGPDGWHYRIVGADGNVELSQTA